MNQKDLQHYKNLLLDKRKEIMDQMEQIKTSDMDTTTKEASGDHSAYSYHMADQGTDNMEREKNFLYAQRDGEILYFIDRALERIEKGSFGKCNECGEYINRPRLEAIPYAQLCINCKSQEEKLPRINILAIGESET